MNKRYALCVGNNYPGTGADLNGCVNDAEEWTELLAKEGYDVTMVAEAGRMDVLSELYRMVSLASFGDRIVFTFSGHGTWIPDTNADEADGRDEALVMAGLTPDDLILDDELQLIFNALKYGSRALVISDSCHSGTISRFSQIPPDKTVAFPGARRFLSPVELDVKIDFERAVELEKAPASPPRRTSSLISGCADHEYSWDAWFNNRANGAFTRAAIDTYMSGISLGGWYQGIRRVLPTVKFPQSPQMTTTHYRKYTRAL